MKYALLSPFYPYRGGIAQFSDRLYRQLVDEGNEVKAFSFSRLYPGFLFPGKTQFVEGASEEEAFAEQILDSINPFSYSNTVKAIKDYNPDVLIIAYWMSFFAPAYGHIASRLKKNTRIVALAHNTIPHESRFFDRPLSRLFFRQVDSFVVLSDAVKADVLSLRPDAEVIVKPHPLYDHYGEAIPQTEAQEQLGIDIGKKTLLFFGLIREYKGLDLLIEAFGRLDDSYQLVIAGECYGSFDKYRNIINTSPGKERIKLIDRYINDDEVPVLFSAADLLVLPYRSATQSGVIPLAYYYELPVVATDTGGLRETVETPGTGLITSPEPQAIEQTIRQFFSQSSDSYKENIRKEKQRLSWKEFVRSLP